jgi:hypothetical protein
MTMKMLMTRAILCAQDAKFTDSKHKHSQVVVQLLANVFQCTGKQ